MGEGGGIWNLREWGERRCEGEGETRPLLFLDMFTVFLCYTCEKIELYILGLS